MSNGIRTTNLERQFSIDELIGNVTVDGVEKTSRFPFSALANQLAGTGAFVFGNSVWAGTEAGLLLAEAPSETAGGVVLNDPDPTKNGYYTQDGEGGWDWQRGLPDSIAVLENVGGTGNAITADTASGVNPADVVLLFLPAPPGTNTSSAVTIAINGGAVEGVKSASGAGLANGDIIDGVGTLFFRSGSEWRQLFSSATGATFDHQGTYAALTAYTEGQVVTGSDGNWYQLKAASATGDDPVSGGSGDWLQILVGAAVSDRSLEEVKLTHRLSARVGALFDTVAELLADTSLSYSNIDAGDQIEAQGFRYEVAASGASDEHLETAGGVKLYLLSDAIDPVALGAVGFVGTKVDWLAELAAGTYTDDYAVLQKAIDILSARANGGELHISRWHASNTPLTVYYGVSIIGDSRWPCGIWKDSTTTKAVTYYQTAATPQVTIYPGSLPTDANAVLILGDSYGSGRWVGRIASVSIGGTYATVDDWESQKVEFGILSIGSVTDFEINDISVDNAEYGALIPTPFVGEIANTRITACLSGIGIGNCTTLSMHGNYASDCRDYGFAFRSGKYSSFFANACDLLNTPTRFPDRTRECTAYVFDSCIGMSIFNNGNEQSWGNSFLLNTLRYCQVLYNQTIQVGSDYEGTEDIAVLKITGALVGCAVTGNNGYAEKAGGLIQGSANSAKHHNLFVVAGTVLNDSTLHNNVVRSVFSGTDGEAGWGNNVGQEALLVKRGGLFVGTDRNSIYRALIQGMGNTSGTYALGVVNSALAAILRLRDDGAVFLPSVGTTASAANAVLDGSNSVLKSTSLRAVKDNIEPVTLEDAMAFLQMEAKTFTSLCEADDPTRRLVGFIAEDAEEHAPLLATHNADGTLQGFQYDRAAALHHRIIQYLAQEIERLKASTQ